MLSKHLICTAVAAAAVMAVPTLEDRGLTPLGDSVPIEEPRKANDYYIPSTKIPMNNVFQGYMDECAGACRIWSACLGFPWGYQTCFDTKKPLMSFSYDHLNQKRNKCEPSVTHYDDDRACPKGQVCLPEIFDLKDPRRRLQGWCIQENVYQMNKDAYCKGRYQKEKLLPSDMLGGKRPAMYLRKPKWLPKASFDEDFETVNPEDIPRDCRE